MASLAEYEAEVAGSVPQAWWKLDDASGLPQDSSGNGFHMTTETISGYQQAGPFGGWDAIEVQGGEGASRASYTSQVNNMTFEAWIRPQIISSSNQNVFFNQAGGSSGWAVLINPSGKIRAIAQGVGFLAESAFALPLNTWTHIVVLRDSGTWRYYINGLLDTVNAGTTAPGASPTSTGIHGSAAYQGKLAQAAAYNHVLTDAEIQAHYEAAAGPYPIPSVGKYKGGGFALPLSTGNFSITQLGFEPQGVLFVYSNQTTEDTVLVGANMGIGIGMMALDWNSSSVISFADSVCPEQATWKSGVKPIYMARDQATLDYSASAVSLDADGFTINVVAAPPAARHIHYLAWGEFDNAGSDAIYQTAVTLALGWKARSCLVVGSGNNGSLAGEGNFSAAAGLTWINIGGGSYPANTSIWCGGYAASIAGPSGQHYNSLQNSPAAPPVSVSEQGHSIGPFLNTHQIDANPTGPSFSSFNEDAGVSVQSAQMFAFWEGQSDIDFWTPDATTGGVSTNTFTNPAVGRPAAVISINLAGNVNGGTPAGAVSALSVGIATEDYQGCVVANGADQSFFQSQQRGFADTVTASGVSAGTIAPISNGFEATTEEDDVGPSSMVFLAFGPPSPRMMWLPQLIRRQEDY